MISPHRRASALVIGIVVALAGCGGDDGVAEGAGVPTSGPTTAASAGTSPATPAPATTGTATSTIAGTIVPPTTVAPTTAAPTTAAPTTDPDAPIVLEILADAGAVPRPEVPLGRAVELRIVSSEPHEFHLHSYELEDRGTEVVFAFTADLAGEFELENHDTEELVATLVVT